MAKLQLYSPIAIKVLYLKVGKKMITDEIRAVLDECIRIYRETPDNGIMAIEFCEDTLSGIDNIYAAQTVKKHKNTLKK